MQSLRSKTPDHSALVFYMTSILDAIENVAMIADTTPISFAHLEDWTCYIVQRAAALELAVFALKEAQANGCITV
jgi:hypothetical protein